MKLCPMRFLGYTWHHNPKSLQISSGKKVVTLSVPYSADVLQNFGEKPLTVSGVGELYGEDCLEQYEQLKKLYEKGDCGVLCLPRLTPLYACFDKLTLEAHNTPSVLTYSFSFTEISKKTTDCNTQQFVEVLQGQTLWDISYLYGVNIDTLVVLNPEIMFINDLTKGEMIRLC